MKLLKTTSIIFTLLLTGCVYDVTRHDIDKAIVVCEKYENILKLRIFSQDDKYVLCYQNEKDVRIGGSN